MTDWLAWHEQYQDPNSSLSRRLRLVRGHLHDWLDGCRGQAVTAISACAGQGHDLIGVLAMRPDAGRVRAVLLESDPRNVAAARLAAAVAGLPQVEVRPADAGLLANYADAVPADLVLLAGVFGNISDRDIRRTIEALPQLCATGATVLWTRSRRDPDLTPSIREWFAAAGLREQAFDAPAGELIAVGVHRYLGQPQSLDRSGVLFRSTSANRGSRPSS
ncbi:MAG TPA: hypothetical protein VFD94_01765 [Jatrophihabitans sp.]|nr:hypothetical protein [Jatrophihabitans sp.]